MEIIPSPYITASAHSDIINPTYIFDQDSGQRSFHWPIVMRPWCELITIRARPSPALNACRVCVGMDYLARLCLSTMIPPGQSAHATDDLYSQVANAWH